MADTVFLTQLVKDSKRRGSHNLKTLAMICMLVINTCLLVTFSGLVIKWMIKRRDALQPVEATTCLAKNEFDPPTCPTGTNAIDNTCCGPSSVILQQLLSQELSSTFDKHVASRLLSGEDLTCDATSRSVCYANLAGIEDKRQEKDYPCHWLDVISNGATYHDGRIYIKEPGYYFAHSQVKLNPSVNIRTDASNNSDDTVSEKTVTYIHNIKHYSHRRKEIRVIIQNTKKHCIRQERRFNTTMSTGAVVMLEKRDHLYVSTSHPGHIVSCNHDNRFSVFKLN